MLGAWLAIRGVRRTFEHLNRRDLDRFLAAWAEDAVFEFPGDVSASGRFAGKAELRGWFERFLANYPGLRFTLEHVAVARPWTLGPSNEVLVQWTIDLENGAGERLQNRGVTSVILRRAKVVAVRDYLFDTGPRFRHLWGEGDGEAAAPVRTGSSRAP